MPTQYTQNRILTPILIGIALLCALFFLKPTYASYIEKGAILSSLENEHTSLTAELNSLNVIQENKFSPEKQAHIEKLARKFDTSDIMSILMLNDYTKDTANGSAPILISSVNVGKGRKLPNGLSIGTVGIALQGKTISDIINYITSLTQDAPYIFTLDSITLPLDTAPDIQNNGSYGLSITLGIYYYE